MSVGAAPVTSCRTCHATICWVTMPSGKKMPLDTVVVESTNPREVLYTLFGLIVPRREGEPCIGHRSHFATCPDAKEWSRRGKP